MDAAKRRVEIGIGVEDQCGGGIRLPRWLDHTPAPLTDLKRGKMFGAFTHGGEELRLVPPAPTAFIARDEARAAVEFREYRAVSAAIFSPYVFMARMKSTVILEFMWNPRMDV